MAGTAPVPAWTTTDLACGPARSDVRPAVQDQRAAHAGAEPETENNAGAARSTFEPFAEQAYVRVIAQGDRDAESVTEVVNHVDLLVPVRQIGDAEDPTLVDHTRNPHPRRDGITVDGRYQVGDRREDGIGTFRGRRRLLARVHLVLVIDQTHLDVRATNIHTSDEQPRFSQGLDILAG